MEDTVERAARPRPARRGRGSAPLDTLPEVDLDELVLDDTVQQRRVPRRHRPRVGRAACTAGATSSQRVVRNLLDNAAPPRAAPRSAVGLRTTDDTVELTVDDDGPGIPRRGPRRCVFERFTRLDDGRARDAAGSGSAWRW